MVTCVKGKEMRNPKEADDDFMSRSLVVGMSLLKEKEMTNECIHECKQVLHINNFPHFSPGNKTKEKQED